jgi:hypothetical protein
MSHENANEPRLIFFRERPTDLSGHPELASSLQHLETSFLLIAMGRYPHALIMCASAIESALREAAREPKWTLDKLLGWANDRLRPEAVMRREELAEFRKMRNQVIHSGFSAKDDEVCATLLLRTGYPLIEQCYDTFHHFRLKRSKEGYGGLVPDIDLQLDIAEHVYARAMDIEGLHFTYCFRAFGHEIRWQVRDWALSDWQRDVLSGEEQTGDRIWEFQRRQKHELSRVLNDPTWAFKCPICGDYEGLVCEIDEACLDRGELRLIRGVCVNCGLAIPANCPFLADELCAGQFEEALPDIKAEWQ